ncbi:muconolactone Delta-isomerase family protein [Nocardioides sp. URHA0032]|uniref:muconolactone Delta-isomerase family protein n=1 Tax=Nocardioides sp. URHA0032 TaxID=1380388 RepID=UPI0004918F8B|nr:muconolactone Delta-isomerase family protein [Nocardioides sp. URHA0032]
MEFLVDMTTHVPEGTSESEVAAMRAREAANTTELVRAGRVLRLWRPPLRPGEWRTLGLFTAAGDADLRDTLGSMPLHVWRRDTVTVLRPHVNDPGLDGVDLDRDATEFFTWFALAIPEGAGSEQVAGLTAAEGARTRALASAGRLLRLWSLPEAGHSLGHWQAGDQAEMERHLSSLPLAGWLTVTTQLLTPHPSDPTQGHATRSSA